MIRNLSSQQILLIAIATVLLLLVAFSFYLLQDPTAPLPFAPEPVNTLLPQTPSPTSTPPPSSTPQPTRQTSYTPFATHATQVPGTPAEITSTSTPTHVTSGTPTSTLPAATTAAASPTTTSGSPSPTYTLQPGEYVVTGRVLRDGTPVPNVLVNFSDDDPDRQAITNQGGHYRFISFAPGTHFVVTFLQADNPQLTPTADIASSVRIEGTLTTGMNVTTLPDLDVNLNLGGMIFGLEAPANNASYSAAAISQSNPIQFNWTSFYQGDSYIVEFGPVSSEDPIWTSNETTSTNLMWNGTLDNGTHISQGTYWWRVRVKNAVGVYTMFVFTYDWQLVFTP